MSVRHAPVSGGRRSEIGIQLRDLEVPGDDEIGIDAALPPETIVSAIRRALAV